MKKLKRLIVFCLSVMMFSSVGISSAGAANIKPIEQGILYFEDGSYLTIDVIEFDSVLTRGTSVVSGKKIGTYSNNSGETLWTITVNGKFTYNGLSATAIDASYSYQIYDSAWSLKSANAYCSGNRAIAEGTFHGGFLLNRDVTVTLTCSPDGKLS